MSLKKAHGNFHWYDLQTNDFDGAIDFYTSVLGWKTAEHTSNPDPNYRMFTVDGVPIGGVMRQDESQTSQGVPPNWMSYGVVPDVKAAMAQVKALGGTVYTDVITVPTIGSFFIFADPQGAAFSAFEPEDVGDGSISPAKPGCFSWHELATSDYEGAFGFYSKVFAWEFSMQMDMGDGWIYKMFKKRGGDFSLGGMFNRPKEMPYSMWLYYIRVEDINAALERVKAHGGKVNNGPMTVPGGDQTAQCQDPQGAMFALHMKVE